MDCFYSPSLLAIYLNFLKNIRSFSKTITISLIVLLSIMSTSALAGVFTSYPSSSNTGNYGLSWNLAGTSVVEYFWVREYKDNVYQGIVASSGTYKALSGRSNGTYRYDLYVSRGVFDPRTWEIESVARVEHSVTVNVLVILNPPSSITVPSSTVTNGNIAISWPASPNATYYTLKESVNNGPWISFTSTITSTSYTRTGRSNGSYRYKIRACNTSCSVSRDSSAVTVLLPPPTPSSISIPTSTVINGSIAISWPSTSTATKYQLQESKNSGSWVTLTSTTTSISYTRTGRTNGSYKYQIRAYNTSGWSAYRQSGSVTVLLPPPTPSSITVPTSTVANGSIAISWPATSTATKYQLQESKNSGSWVTLTSTTTSISYTRTGRTNGSYKYQIRAYNTSGWSAYRQSGSVTVLLPPPTPSSITVPTSTVTNGSIAISWPATSTATKYQLQESKNSGSWVTLTSTTTSISYTRTGRTNGSYKYRVRAYNTSGWSAYRQSGSATVLLPSPVPSSITVPTSTVTNGSIAISWTAASTATSYTLQESVNSGAWATITSPTSTSYTRTGRGNGSYQYQVRSCNASGCSGWKASSSVTVLLPEDWMLLAPVAVADAGGSNLAPAESVDLSAATVKGQAGVSGGQASYSMPIDLPPGRNGVQPAISISYNSQGGNGVLGMGWSLNAGSSISRCGATFAQDSFTRAVTFDSSSDKLCLNGQRLIAVSGVYGASGTQYRTEMDSLVKVIQNEGINSSSSSFTVLKPDGNSATYGNNTNSRFAPSGLTTTLSWKVTQELFSNGANTIDYEYDDSVPGEHLLSSIYYTGSNAIKGDRQVEFVYQSRPDTRQSYMSGGKIRTTRRLSTVNTYTDPTTIVASYNLTYDTSLSSERSLLTHIDHCSATGQCTPKTQFNWLTSAINYQVEVVAFKSGATTVEPENTPYIAEVTPVADVDGNGAPDWPQSSNSTSGYSISAEGSVMDTVGKNGHCYSPIASNNVVCVSGDINGDGRADEISFGSYGGSADALGIKYSGTQNWIETDILNNHALEAILAINDYNGDGWPDLVMLDSDLPVPIPTSSITDAKILIYFHTGSVASPYTKNNAFELVQDAISGTGGSSRGIHFESVGDFDGNGLNDFILYSNRGVIPTLAWPEKLFLSKISPSTNTYYTEEVLFDGHLVPGGNLGQASFFHDVNGDNLPDWMAINSDAELSVRVNTGDGFTSNWQPLNIGIPMRQVGFLYQLDEPEWIWFPILSKTFSFDYDGNGIQELMTAGDVVASGCAQIKRWINNGTQLVDNWLCDEQLYQPIQGEHDAYAISSIPVNIYDVSARQYDAIHFTINNDGSINATQKPSSIIASPGQVATVDANGDGLTDVITTFACIRTNCKFNTETAGLGGNTVQDVSIENKITINRNLGSWTGSATSSAGLYQYQAQDVLASSVDGFGNTSTWRYRPMSTGETSAIDTVSHCDGYSSSPFYCTDNPAVGDGYVHFASSMNVVQSFKQSNGQNGENETQYAYKGAMFNLRGRGFTGFNQTWEKDMQRNKTVHSTFSQKFPDIGQLTAQTISVNGQTTLQLNNTWQDNANHANSAVRVKGVYLNQLTSAIQTSYDLNGVKLSTINTQHENVDQYGNVGLLTKTVSDFIHGSENAYTNEVETQFTPINDNGTSWWLTKHDWTEQRTSLASRSWVDDPVGTLDKVQSQRQTVNTWNTMHHLPQTVTYTASGSSCNRVASSVFNSYGLATSVTQTGQSSTCASLVARTTSFTYTLDGLTQNDAGYLPYTVTNAKGHLAKTEYHMGFGVPTKITAPNNMVTETVYDAIGRPVQVSQAGSPTSYMRYLLASEGAHAPQNNTNISVLMTRTTGAGMPNQEQYLDNQGRLLRVATQGFDGGYQYQDKHYDTLGRLTKESIPYGNGTVAEYTEYSGFDALDRPAQRTIPNGKAGGLTSFYSYNGLTTDINVEGRIMSRTYGVSGWLYETEDAGTLTTNKGRNRFAYDAAGQPLVIQDANGNEIKVIYNGFGHKVQVNDPNQGITLFGYNTFGELDKKTDANNVVETYVFDTLGRITNKAISGGNAPSSATYVWDTLKEGLLTAETENNVTRAYAYSPVMQLTETTVTVDGNSRTVKHQYDSFYGRPKALEYPNGLTLQYSYNTYGYLDKTSNAASGYVYRQITAMDEAGHITGATLADNIMSESREYNNEGTMATIEVSSPQGTIHSHDYQSYDNFMNLTNEYNGTTSLSKSYRYDRLNRLEEYSFSNLTPNFSAKVNYVYDKVGNFLKKTDYSANAANAYRYGGAACSNKPNAVCQLDKLNGTTVNYQYDAKGNLSTGDGLTITYNAMDKPLTVSGRGPNNNTLTAFVYGSDNMRAKQTRTVSGATTTTYYVDKYFEEDNDGSWRAYIDNIALLSYTQARGHLIQFTLKDRLDSTTTLADHNGNIISQRYFDPFGRTADMGNSHRIDIDNANTQLSQFTDLSETNKNRRGFTDHEHMNEQQLIHMNGRVYDYNLGRFLSVDPLIQAPTSTQSINPYSYIMNNPLTGTDPTGYCSAASRIGGRSSACKSTSPTVDGVNHKKASKPETAKPVASGASGGQEELDPNLDLKKVNGQVGGGKYDTQSSEHFDDGLSSEIQSQARKIGQKMGGDDNDQRDGVIARLGEIAQDENGVVTKASIICGRSCQSQAGLYTYEHSISLIRQRNMEDPTMMVLRVMHGYSDRITNNNVTRLMSISPNPLAQEISAGIGVYRLLVHQDFGGYGGTAASGVAAQRAEQISGSKKAGGKVGAATSLAYEILKEFN